MRAIRPAGAVFLARPRTVAVARAFPARSRSVAAACALLACVTAVPAQTGPPRAIPVEVGAAGWIRVMVFSSPGELGEAYWAVLDPAGRPLPHLVMTPQSGDIPVAATTVDESPDGWSIVFDLGPVPLVHDGITLELTGRAAVRCALDAGDDRRTWTPLAQGGVFRLGDGASLAKGTIEYPLSRARFVRVRWPRAAGLPELSKATVRAREWTPPAGAALAGRERASTADGDGAVDLGAPDLVVSTFAGLTADALTGALAGHDGHWRPASFPWRAGAFRLRRMAGRPVTAVIEPTWLMFRATAPATFRITAGSAPRLAESGWEDARIVDVAPGPAQPLEPPALTDASTALVSIERLPRRWSSWPITFGARDPAPAEVVRVDLPEGIFEPGIADEFVRPAVGRDRVVPFALAREPRPRRVLSDPAREALADGRVAVALPRAAGALTQIELALDAPEGPRVAREVTVHLSYRAVTRPGAPENDVPGATQTVRCGETGPCHALFDLAPPPVASAAVFAVEPREVRITAASLWARRSALVFAWPARGDVRIVSGFDPLNARAPQVVAVRAQVLARKARSGTLDLAGTAEEGRRTDRAVRVAVFASIVLVGAVLLFVLARSLRRAPRQVRPGPGPGPGPGAGPA